MGAISTTQHHNHSHNHHHNGLNSAGKEGRRCRACHQAPEHGAGARHEQLASAAQELREDAGPVRPLHAHPQWIFALQARHQVLRLQRCHQPGQALEPLFARSCRLDEAHAPVRGTLGCEDLLEDRLLIFCVCSVEKTGHSGTLDPKVTGCLSM